jgi:hypothetical protein
VSSIRKQIIDAVMARLNTSTPGGVPQTTRARQEPYDPSELPAITVKPQREQIDYEALGKRSYFRKREMTLRVSVHFTGDDSVADPMTVWITSQLDGQVFPSLIEDCKEENNEWEYAAEDQPYLVLHQDFRVVYHTLVGDQTRTQ